MTVKITKPQINVREQLNELKKPTGVAGEAMLRAETPQEQQALVGVGRRNLLINGNFLIWQRNGTSVVDSTNGPYNYITADRWVTYYDGTYAQIEDTLPTGEIAKTMRYTVGSGGNAPNFNQPVENGANIMAGQTVTMSWWMKASKRSTINSRLPNTASGVFAGGNSQYDLTVTNLDTHEVTTSWTYHTATKTFPSSMTHSNIHFELWGDNSDWATSDTFQMANCQLELGNVATPFEHRSYGEELALCQRYYEKIAYDTSTDSGGGAAAETLICNGLAYANYRSLNYLKFNTPKRVQPTTTIVGGVSKIEVLDVSGGWVTSTAFNARSNTHGARLDMTHPSQSLTVGNALEVRLLSGGYLNIDAEL
jgi:hypothetical protein